MFKDPLQLFFPGKRLNRSLRILIASNTTLVFALGLFGPFYAVFVQKIGGSIAFAGLSWAIFGIVTGILTLLFSRWQLRVKEQELLVALGYLIRATVFLSYAFMQSMAQLLFTQVLWGVAAAISNPAFDAVYAEHTDHQDAVQQWGRWEGISSIASGLAAIVGGILIEALGYQPVFIMMAAIMTLLALYIWRLPREVL